MDNPPSHFDRIVQPLKRYAVRVLGVTAARLLRPAALEDERVRTALWTAGIGAQAKGFYSSLVDPRELVEARTVPSQCAGIDFHPSLQLRCLTDVFPRFRDEFSLILHDRPHGWDEQPRFFLANDAFNDIDPFAYWAVIRLHQPRRIVEIGSGYSTLLAAQAVRRNRTGRVTAIDPFPRRFVRQNDLGIEVMQQKVEDTPLEFFTSLEADDILFIDSSHVVRAEGDTTFLFFEVLPRLNEGVIVHFHDIHLPFDYPRDLIGERNVYWTEQYLLQAYLLKNTSDEVFFGSRYSAHYFPEQTRQAFPTAPRLNGASFWLRSHNVNMRPAGTIPQTIDIQPPCD